jgi:hypothetical protein
MSLKRTETRFGRSLIKETPEPDNQSIKTSSSNYNPSKKLKKKSFQSQDDDDQSHNGHSLAHETIQRREYDPRLKRGDGAGAARDLIIKEGLPWVKAGSLWEKDFFVPRYELSLNDSVIIASREDTSLVAVRTFSGRDAMQKILMLERIGRHEKFLATLGYFHLENSYYIILEHDIGEIETVSMTLSQFALAGHYVEENQLANILKQVSPFLDSQYKFNKKIQILLGLKHLHSKRLHHGSISCTNILVGNRGSIKIGRSWLFFTNIY